MAEKPKADGTGGRRMVAPDESLIDGRSVFYDRAGNINAYQDPRGTLVPGPEAGRTRWDMTTPEQSAAQRTMNPADARPRMRQYNDMPGQYEDTPVERAAAKSASNKAAMKEAAPAREMYGRSIGGKHYFRDQASMDSHFAEKEKALAEHEKGLIDIPPALSAIMDMLVDGNSIKNGTRMRTADAIYLKKQLLANERAALEKMRAGSTVGAIPEPTDVMQEVQNFYAPPKAKAGGDAAADFKAKYPDFVEPPESSDAPAVRARMQQEQ